jgi:hypothetical protein
MTSYKDPSFQERVGRAAKAKQKALDQLRSKPPVDQAVLAERQAARQRREAASADKRAVRQEREQAAKAAKADEAAKIAAAPASPTEEERKLARDARYAARKSRK